MTATVTKRVILNKFEFGKLSINIKATKY